MRKMAGKRKLLVVGIAAMLLVVPIVMFARVGSPATSPNQETIIVEPEPLASNKEASEKLKEIQKGVDFPILVPTYLPAKLQLAKKGIAYRKALGPFSDAVWLMYDDSAVSWKGDVGSIRSIEVYQRKALGEVAWGRIEKECERIYTPDGRKVYVKIEVQGVTAYWTPYGTEKSCSTPEQSSGRIICELDSSSTRVFWWANGAKYEVRGKNIPSDEVLAFVRSLTPLE